jgi:ATP-dependent protease ClpP protease subunit
VKALAEISAPAIDLRVNSPGGLVFDAVAIYTALQQHTARVDVRIDGIAASAASFIAQAGDTITIAKPARMMIHDAQGFTIGGPAEHREMLNLLDDLSDMIAEIYADRAGGTVADWREPMKATTWYSAAAAVESGLADTIAGADEDEDEDDGGPADRASQLLRARARVTLGMHA